MTAPVNTEELRSRGIIAITEYDKETCRRFAAALDELDRLRAELALERDRCPECRCVRSDPKDMPLDVPCKSCGKLDIMAIPSRKTDKEDD